MATIEAFALASRSGTLNVPAQAVAADASSVSLWIDRSQWTDETATIGWEIEISLDNGATWSSLGGACGKGGVVRVDQETAASQVFDAMGARLLDQSRAMTYSGSRRVLPDVGNASRLVRASVTLSKATTIRVMLEVT